MATSQTNLKDLVEVQSASATDNLLLFNKTTNVASRIDFDDLSSSMLGQIPTQISDLESKTAYSSVLTSTTYATAAAALAALDTYADGLGGSARIVGYISTANSNVLGLTNTSHYFDFYINSASYRLIVARPVNGADIYQLAKQGGTWATTWVSLNKNSLSYNIDRYTQITNSADLNTFTTPGQYRSSTSTITNSLSNCPVTGYGFTLNVFPTGTANFFCQEIYAPTGTTATGKVALYRRFVNARDSLFGEWIQFATKTDVAGITWSTDSAVKITTSLTDYVSSSANGVYYLWSTSTDATTVGAPSSNSYHYLVVKVNSNTAIIQAHKMVTDGDAFYVKQLYGGNWGTDWTQIDPSGRVVKTTLSTTQVYANETASAYNSLDIPGLSDYMVVLLNVNCANLRQTLVFVNGDGDQQYLYEIGSTNKIRAGFYIDWENNRVRVRYLSAEGAYTYQNVYFTKVVGFIKQ